MRRWSFGKRCWVQGGERKSKWLETVYKEELTNDLFPLVIDNLFLPKEDARGNGQPGALVGDTVPVLGHPEPRPLTEAEQPQWLLYLARMAETFGRTRDTFRLTKQLRWSTSLLPLSSVSLFSPALRARQERRIVQETPHADNAGGVQELFERRF